MGWACVVLGAGDESSPRAFVEFGEHPIGQSLKRPADAVLTGKRQCQPGGKQGAENQRGGHGKGAPWGEKTKAADAREGLPRAGAQVADGDFCAQGISPKCERFLAIRGTLISDWAIEKGLKGCEYLRRQGCEPGRQIHDGWGKFSLGTTRPAPLPSRFCTARLSSLGGHLHLGVGTTSGTTAGASGRNPFVRWT
jgi:hypothetical protein